MDQVQSTNAAESDVAVLAAIELSTPIAKRQSAISSLRASATIGDMRRRPLASAVRARN